MSFSDKLMEKIEDKWSDEEVLANFLMFLNRVDLHNEILQDKHGFMTHQRLHIICGKKIVTSPPVALDWPMEPVSMPIDKEELN